MAMIKKGEQKIFFMILFFHFCLSQAAVDVEDDAVREIAIGKRESYSIEDIAAQISDQSQRAKLLKEVGLENENEVKRVSTPAETDKGWAFLNQFVSHRMDKGPRPLDSREQGIVSGIIREILSGSGIDQDPPRKPVRTGCGFLPEPQPQPQHHDKQVDPAVSMGSPRALDRISRHDLGSAEEKTTGTEKDKDAGFFSMPGPVKNLINRLKAESREAGRMELNQENIGGLESLEQLVAFLRSDDYRQSEMTRKIPSLERKKSLSSGEAEMHYGIKPGQFETSIIHFPTSEGVSE